MNTITLTWKSAAFAAFCIVIPAVVVTLLLAPQISDNTNSIDQAALKAKTAQVLAKSTRSSQNAIIDVIRRTCEQDHKFRIQYKVRGKAEKKLLALFLELAKANAHNGTNVGLNEGFIDEFKPLLKRIHIIPPPDCDAQARRLRHGLRVGGSNDG